MRKTEQNKLTKTSVHRAYNAQQTGENGITLVSLVVTIIVLLILAGVGINMAINSDGLFAKAGEATEEWNTAVGQEETTINNLVDTLEEFSPSLKPMVTKWNIAAGDTVNIYLYYSEDGNGNALSDNTDVTIDWGDGTEEHYTSNNLQYEDWGGGYIEHTYTTANSNNIVTINGKCNAIEMAFLPQLTSIEQWGYTETYVYVFASCPNLVTIASPEKYTFKNVTDFIDTFAGCTGITRIPNGLFANCSNTTSFVATFVDCTGLTSIGDYAFANCTSVTNFNGTFYGCENLTIIGAHAFDGCSSVTSFSSLFKQPTSLGTKMNDEYTVERCIVVSKEYEVMPVRSLPTGYNTNITRVGDYAFANCTNVTSFESAFEGCTGLTSIGDYAFANCTAVTSFRRTFKGCTNLQNIPDHLFENTPNVTSFEETFRYCTSLTGDPIPLWERVPDGINNNYNGTPNGLGCYDGCTGLTDYTDIPFFWRVWLE